MPDAGDDSEGVSRRRVLRATAAAGGVAAVGARTASANVVTTIAFCGCSQVVVYGRDLDDPNARYIALVYEGEPPNGTFGCRELTGSSTRVNYETDGPKILALIGRTNPQGSSGPGEQSFVVCNDYGPWRCSEKALRELSSRQSELVDCLVTAAETGGTEVLRIDETADGSKVGYDFAVTGTLDERHDTVETGFNDEIDGTTATGTVGPGQDAFNYTGTIDRFALSDGYTGVTVNGVLVNPRCGTADLDTLGITVRSGRCGPEDKGGGPPDDKGGGPPEDKGGGPPDDKGGH